MKQDSDSDQRPQLVDAFLSPTVGWSVAAAMVLLATFFLPHSHQADQQVSRPVWTALDLWRGRTDRPMLYLTALWPYGYGLATVATMVWLTWRRPSHPADFLLAIPLVGNVVLFTLWLLLLFGGSESSRMAMGIAAVGMPLGMCGGARVWWLYRRDQVASAAAWWHSLICVLAAFSLRWSWFPEVDRMAWGGWLAITAVLFMMIASWIWVPRARFDLLDRGSQPGRIRFTVSQILICVTLSAIALTYWQALEHWR